MEHFRRIASVITIVLILDTYVRGQQVLTKTARIVNEDSNPDEFEITIKLGSTIPNGSNAVLQDFVTDLVVRNNALLNGPETITVNVGNISADDIGTELLKYIATFNLEKEIGDFLNLTSNLTYISSATNELKSELATLCLKKVINTDYGLIAAVLIPCLLFGFIIVIVILILALNCCPACRRSVEPSKERMKTWTSSNKVTPSLILHNSSIGIPHVLGPQENMVVFQKTEAIYLRRVIAVERFTRSSVNGILFVLFEQVIQECYLNAENMKKIKNGTLNEIQETMEKNNEEHKILDSTTLNKKEQELADMDNKHKREYDELSYIISQFPHKTQEELLLLLKQKHVFESQETDWINTLRMKESELKKDAEANVRFLIISQRIKQILSENQRQDELNIHRSIKDSYNFLVKAEKRIFDQEVSTLKNVKVVTLGQTRKIIETEKEYRQRWNKMGHYLLNLARRTNRNSDSQAYTQKDFLVYIQETMLKCKQQFEEESAKAYEDFLKLCEEEMRKSQTSYRILKIHKSEEEQVFPWVKRILNEIKTEIQRQSFEQKRLDDFVIDSWRQKKEAILTSVEKRMESLRDEVIRSLNVQDNFKTVYEQSKADITEGSFPTGNLTTAKLPSSEIVRAGEKTLLDKILNYQIFSSASQSEDLSSVLVYQLNGSTCQVGALLQQHETLRLSINMQEEENADFDYSQSTEDKIRSKLESDLNRWRESCSFHENSRTDVTEFYDRMLSSKSGLKDVVSHAILEQIKKLSSLEQLQRDIRCLERVIITQLQLLLSNGKISTQECKVVLQEHENQLQEIQKMSSQRTRMHLEHNDRLKGSQTTDIPKYTMNENYAVKSQGERMMNTLENIIDVQRKTIQRTSETSRKMFALSRKLHEQEATEHTELKLKLVQALVKVSKVSHNEMTAVLSLLLPHRNVSKINLMIQFIYSGIPVDAVSDSKLSVLVRQIISQNRHRLAENVLLMDEDFSPSPLISHQFSNSSKRAAQLQHRIPLEVKPRSRLSPLLGIRPETLGGTTDEQIEGLEYQRDVFSNSHPSKRTRRRPKKQFLKNLKKT